MSAEGRFESLLGEAVRAVAAVQAAIGTHLQTAGADAVEAERLLGAYRLVQRAAEVLGGDAGSKERALVVEADDLTRIAGVDALAATRLGALGITRFAQMAAWEPPDVAAVALALDLGAEFVEGDVIGQAQRLVAATAGTGAVADGAVSSWCGRPMDAAGANAILAQVAPRADALAELHAVLRRGPPKSELQPLCALAPALAGRVPVCERRFEANVGVPWAPRPLFGAGIPGVPAALRVSRQVLDAERPADERRDGTSETTPSIDLRPMHERALDRIARLDAEIAMFGQQAQVGNGAAEVDAATAAAALPAQAPAASMPQHVLAVEEAHVEIGVRAVAMELVLEPMPELPLRAVRRPIVSEFRDGGAVEVVEAAVVIVKRRSRERAAPDLAFYKSGEVA